MNTKQVETLVFKRLASFLILESICIVMFLVEKVKFRSHSWFKANLFKEERVVNEGLHKFKTNM